MPLQQGQVLNNRYRIVKLLGQGGYGAVYRAWDLSLKGACALKENFDIGPDSVRQFEKEAIILAKLRHPNLPRVIDHFLLPGQGQYLVMDFVEGDELDALIVKSGRPIDEKTAVDWTIQVSDALSYLHNQNPPVIHRDIKPTNIIIDPRGKANLVDFGICKLYDPQSSTSKGARGVSPGFSPPEQYGTGSTDARSDVYSLGATLYYALTMKAPPDAVERLVRHLPLTPAAIINTSVSIVVDESINKALQVEIDDRFQSVREFQEKLSGSILFKQPQASAGSIQPTTVIGSSRYNPPLTASNQEAGFIGSQRIDSQKSPTESTKKPVGIIRVGWFCILAPILMLLLSYFGPLVGIYLFSYGLTSLAVFILVPLGIVGGILLLRSKKWGRWLCITFLLLFMITNLYNLFWVFL